MRSTTSLMPGERVSCVGCHEPKREAGAAAAPRAVAMKKPAQELAVPPEGGRVVARVLSRDGEPLDVIRQLTR